MIPPFSQSSQTFSGQFSPLVEVTNFFIFMMTQGNQGRRVGIDMLRALSNICRQGEVCKTEDSLLSNLQT